MGSGVSRPGSFRKVSRKSRWLSLRSLSGSDFSDLTAPVPYIYSSNDDPPKGSVKNAPSPLPDRSSGRRVDRESTLRKVLLSNAVDPVRAPRGQGRTDRSGPSAVLVSVSTRVGRIQRPKAPSTAGSEAGRPGPSRIAPLRKVGQTDPTLRRPCPLHI